MAGLDLRPLGTALVVGVGVFWVTVSLCFTYLILLPSPLGLLLLFVLPLPVTWATIWILSECLPVPRPRRR